MIAALLRGSANLPERGEIDQGQKLLTQAVEAGAGHGYDNLAAGLSEVRLVKAPDAALHWLIYQELLTSDPDRTYMIVDHGGGTCNVAILRTFSRDQETKIVGQYTQDHRRGVGGDLPQDPETPGIDQLTD